MLSFDACRSRCGACAVPVHLHAPVLCWCRVSTLCPCGVWRLMLSFDAGPARPLPVHMLITGAGADHPATTRCCGSTPIATATECRTRAESKPPVTTAAAAPADARGLSGGWLQLIMNPPCSSQLESQPTCIMVPWRGWETGCLFPTRGGGGVPCVCTRRLATRPHPLCHHWTLGVRRSGHGWPLGLGGMVAASLFKKSIPKSVRSFSTTQMSWL